MVDHPHPPKDAAWERWTAVALRSVHLAGVVAVGAGVIAGQPVSAMAAWVLLGSGLLMLTLDLRARRLSLRELAGGFVLLKLALVAWMAWDPQQAGWLFWLLLITSSVASHAPKDFRHWPSRMGATTRPKSSSRPLR
jgi:hypothetical protein